MHGEPMRRKDPDVGTGHDHAMWREQKVMRPAVTAVVGHQGHPAFVPEQAPTGASCQGRHRGGDFA